MKKYHTGNRKYRDRSGIRILVIVSFWGFFVLTISGCIFTQRAPIIGDERVVAQGETILNDPGVLTDEDIFIDEDTRNKITMNMEAAKEAFEEGNYEKAIIFLRSVLALVPQNQEVKLLLKSAERLLKAQEDQAEEEQKRKKADDKKSALKRKAAILKLSLEEIENRKQSEQCFLNGLNLYQKQEYEPALLEFKKGLLLDPQSEKNKQAVDKLSKRLHKIKRQREHEEAIALKLKALQKQEEEKKQKEKKIGKDASSEEEDKIQRYMEDKLEEEFVFESFPPEMTKQMREEFLKEKSIEIYREAVKRFPMGAFAGKACYKIAAYSFEKKMYDLAKVEYEKILRQYFDSGYAEEALFRVAQIDFLKGNLDEAVSNCYRFIDTFLHSERRKDAYLLLARIYEKQQKYDKSYKAYQDMKDFIKNTDRIAEIDFKVAKLYLKQGNTEGALEIYNKIINENKNNRYYDKAQFQKANYFFIKKDYSQAKVEYINIIRSYSLNPYAFAAYKKLAAIFSSEGDYVKAVNMYNQLIQNFPFADNLREIYILRAEAYKAGRFYPKAIESFENVIKYYPEKKEDNYNLLFQIGLCYAVMDEIKEAEDVFQKIIHDPQVLPSLQVQAGFKNAEIVLKIKNYDRALQVYNDLLPKIREPLLRKEVLLKMGECYKHLDRWMESMPYYQEIYSQAYNEKEGGLVYKALLNAADCYYKEGEYQAALPLYQRIVKEFDSYSKGDIWPFYQTGKCQEKLKLYDEAVSVYKEIVTKHKDNYLAQQAQWDIKNLEWYTTSKKDLEEKVLQ